jgi:hypothetical protein
MRIRLADQYHCVNIKFVIHSILIGELDVVRYLQSTPKG